MADEYYIRATNPSAPTDVVLWWMPNGCGYTCDLDKAGVYNADYIASLHRATDVPYEKALVDQRAVRAVLCDKLPSRVTP